MLSIVSLSPLTAVLWCLFLGVLFVGTLYIWRSGTWQGRNNPQQVKNRFVSVSIATVLSLLLLRVLLCEENLQVREGYADIVGIRLWRGAFILSIAGLLHVATLFLGPLAVRYLDDDWILEMEDDAGVRPYRTLLEALRAHVHSIYWWRVIVVGPAAEEIVFRACMCPVLQRARFSNIGICFLAPLFFGVAHLHHYYELRKTHSAKTAMMAVMFQFCYTYLFGVYTCYLFMRTGCIYACIVAHAFCNYMGFPDLDVLVSHKYKKLLWVLHVGGIIGFYYLFKII